MEDLLRMDACLPIPLPAAMEYVTTPLRWQDWDNCLRGHPDQRFRHYIVEWIRHTFRIGFDYSQRTETRSSLSNMAPASEHPEVVREYLATECNEGRMLGPLDPTRFPAVHTSPFGVIPKGSWRLIVAPEGASDNDGINKQLGSLTYVGVDDAAEGICSFGQEAFLAKINVKSAYRNILVHRDDRWLMGMCWDEALLLDTTLPFGLWSAPKIFTAVADAVEWIVRQQGVQFVIHYLDDFLVMGPRTHRNAWQLCPYSKGPSAGWVSRLHPKNWRAPLPTWFSWTLSGHEDQPPTREAARAAPSVAG